MPLPSGSRTSNADSSSSIMQGVLKTLPPGGLGAPATFLAGATFAMLAVIGLLVCR